MTWVLTEFDGTAGTETVVAMDVPVMEQSITRTLDAPGGGSVTIPFREEFLGSDRRPIFRPYRHALWWYDGTGVCRGGGVVVEGRASSQQLTLTLAGMSGLLDGQPWTYPYGTGVVGVDAARVQIYLLSAYKRLAGDINLSLGPVGAAGPVGTQADPYLLNRSAMTDLGQAYRSLGESHGIESLDVTTGQPGSLTHTILRGRPLGVYRDNVRLEVGVNVSEEPEFTLGRGFASGVAVLGAGEGQRVAYGFADHPSPGLPHVAVLHDKRRTTNTAAYQAAQAVLSRRWVAGGWQVSQVTLRPDVSAPAWGWFPGDWLMVRGRDGWTGGVGTWARVLSDTTDLTTGETVLTLLDDPSTI